MYSGLPPHFSCDRGDIDDLTSRLLQKYRYGGLTAIEPSFEIYCQNEIPLRLGDLQEVRLTHYPGIVHENIHPSKVVEYSLKHAMDFWLPGNISLDLYCYSTHPFDFGYNPVSGINVAGVVDYSLSTLFRQQNRNGLSDASASPSYDSYLFIKIHTILLFENSTGLIHCHFKSNAPKAAGRREFLPEHPLAFGATLGLRIRRPPPIKWFDQFQFLPRSPPRPFLS